MKIKMLKTSKGSLNGINVQDYKAGKTYDITESLYKCFLGDKVCELVREKKKIDSPPENKALFVSENKSKKAKKRRK